MSKMEQPFQDDSSQEEVHVSSEWNKWAPAVNVAAKNWKAWLAFSKVAPMPAKNWKKDFDKFAVKPMEKKEKPAKNTQKQSETDQNEAIESKTIKHQQLRRTPLKRSQKPLKKTPLAPIWKKKKERLKNEWSEVDVFLERWETGDQCCEICLRMWKSREESLVKKAFINGKLIKPQCFPHILSKWLYPRFRMLVENIWLVCWIEHHDEFDILHRDQEVRNWIEQKLDIILSQKQSCDQ